MPPAPGPENTFSIVTWNRNSLWASCSEYHVGILPTCNQLIDWNFFCILLRRTRFNAIRHLSLLKNLIKAEKVCTALVPWFIIVDTIPIHPTNSVIYSSVREYVNAPCITFNAFSFFDLHSWVASHHFLLSYTTIEKMQSDVSNSGVSISSWQWVAFSMKFFPVQSMCTTHTKIR